MRNHPSKRSVWQWRCVGEFISYPIWFDGRLWKVLGWCPIKIWENWEGSPGLGHPNAGTPQNSRDLSPGFVSRLCQKVHSFTYLSTVSGIWPSHLSTLEPLGWPLYHCGRAGEGKSRVNISLLVLIFPQISLRENYQIFMIIDSCEVHIPFSSVCMFQLMRPMEQKVKEFVGLYIPPLPWKMLSCHWLGKLRQNH